MANANFIVFNLWTFVVGVDIYQANQSRKNQPTQENPTFHLFTTLLELNPDSLVICKYEILYCIPHCHKITLNRKTWSFHTHTSLDNTYFSTPIIITISKLHISLHMHRHLRSTLIPHPHNFTHYIADHNRQESQDEWRLLGDRSLIK